MMRCFVLKYSIFLNFPNSFSFIQGNWSQTIYHFNICNYVAYFVFSTYCMGKTMIIYKAILLSM